jgi:hypothetical protein
MSFDQLSLYVRRASNSSLSLLNVASLHSNVMSTFSSKEDENKKKRLQDKIKNGKKRNK